MGKPRAIGILIGICAALAGCGDGARRSVGPSPTPRPTEAFDPGASDEPPPARAPPGLTPERSPVIARACDRAALHTSLTVVCPPLTPRGGRHAIAYAGRLNGRTGPHDSYAIDVASSSLRRRSDPSQPGHWGVGAARSIAVLRRSIFRPSQAHDCRFRRRRGLDTPAGPCAPVIRHRGLMGIPVLVYRMPPFPTGGLHGGHLVYVWQGRAAAYYVSVHDPANRTRAEAITAAMVAETVG